MANKEALEGMSLRGHERRLKIVARLTAFHDAGCRLRVANAEMLSLTARRRLVLSRTGRSRHDCPKSGMRHIAPGGGIDVRHADFGGPGHERAYGLILEISA